MNKTKIGPSHFPTNQSRMEWGKSTPNRIKTSKPFSFQKTEVTSILHRCSCKWIEEYQYSLWISTLLASGQNSSPRQTGFSHGQNLDEHLSRPNHFLGVSASTGLSTQPHSLMTLHLMMHLILNRCLYCYWSSSIPMLGYAEDQKLVAVGPLRLVSWEGSWQLEGTWYTRREAREAAFRVTRAHIKFSLTVQCHVPQINTSLEPSAKEMVTYSTMFSGKSLVSWVTVLPPFSHTNLYQWLLW